jgi:hypothetical protein
MKWKVKAALLMFAAGLAGLTASLPTPAQPEPPQNILVPATLNAAPCDCGVNLPPLNVQNLKLAPVQIPAKHPRGHKPAPEAVRKALHDESFKRHGHRIGHLPKATQASFDCRTAFGNVLPTDDQKQCGDCFGVSSFDGCSMALVKAGVLPLDASKGRLSSQYGLDSGAFEGGCGGGDEAQVIDWMKNKGAPLTSDYGPYQGGPGRLKPISGMAVYKIGDYGFCTPSQQQGPASDQDIKNCMAQYGPISVAFDASGCDNYQWPQVMSGRGNSVDHAVLCIGWDDSKGAFLGMNQWGDSWGGPNGTFWIAYGSYSWGTEAIWMTAGAVPPPPAPVPPVPPIPPTPPPAPVPPASGLPTQAQWDALDKLIRPQLPPPSSGVYLPMPPGDVQPAWVRTRQGFFRHRYMLAY